MSLRKLAIDLLIEIDPPPLMDFAYSAYDSGADKLTFTFAL